jgi:hypothetical protein
MELDGQLDVHYREWPRSHFKPNHAWVIVRCAYGSPLRPRSGHDLYERSSSRSCARLGGPTWNSPLPHVVWQFAHPCARLPDSRSESCNPLQRPCRKWRSNRASPTTIPSPTTTQLRTTLEGAARSCSVQRGVRRNAPNNTSYLGAAFIRPSFVWAASLLCNPESPARSEWSSQCKSPDLG